MTFIYKQRFFTCLLVLGYAYLHSTLCGHYTLATSEQLMLGQAPLPFAQRLLIPWLQKTVYNLTNAKATDLFFLFELLFTALFYRCLLELMKIAFDTPKAMLLTWLFFLLLPLITLVNYRLTIGGSAPFFYAYDTPTLFFMAAGYCCCLRQQWFFFYLVVFLATLNRESSILLVLLIPALYWQEKKHVIKPALISTFLFLTGKALVLLATAKIAGTLVSLYKLHSPYTVFSFNLLWLFEHTNILLFVFCMAGLPALWFTFYDYIPHQFRPLRYIVLLYFIGLLFVGIFPESRIFSELAILLYLPVCIAIKQWLMGEAAISAGKDGLWYFIDRYAVIGALILLVVFRGILDQLVIEITRT